MLEHVSWTMPHHAVPRRYRIIRVLCVHPASFHLFVHPPRTPLYSHPYTHVKERRRIVAHCTVFVVLDAFIHVPRTPYWSVPMPLAILGLDGDTFDMLCVCAC